MKTIAIKMKTYGRAVSIVNNDNISTRILHTLLSSLLILAVLYVFLLGSMVYNIVERRSLEADARNISNEVRDLELTYLSKSNSIDLELSYSLGFAETKPKYVTRKALGSISISQNEI